MNVGSAKGGYPSLTSTESQLNVSLKTTNHITPGMSVNEVEMALKSGLKISLGEEKLVQAIEKAVSVLQGPTTRVDISVHAKTNDLMIKVYNKDTGDLIREIPPEKTLDMVAKMMEIAGLLIDEKI